MSTNGGLGRGRGAAPSVRVGQTTLNTGPSNASSQAGASKAGPSSKPVTSQAAVTKGASQSRAPWATAHVNASSGVANGNVEQPVQGTGMRDRLLMLVLAMIGSHVIVRTIADGNFAGILSSTSHEAGDLGVTLAQAYKIPQPTSGSEGTWNLLTIAGKDVVEIEAIEVKLAATARKTKVSGRRSEFQTDTEISGQRLGEGPERELQAWADDGPAPQTDSMLSSINDNRPWDQFATNEEKFGLKSNYREELYTTKLDRSGANFAAKEKEAERIAAEIMSQATTDAHLAEERGLADDSGENEEDKYGAVQRDPNAYVPPARRKNGQAASAKTLAAVSQSAIARSNQENLATSASGSTAGTSSKKTQAGVYEQFGRFVQREQSQAQAALQQQQAKKEKDIRLAELKSWGSSFKLKSPMPSEIADMSAKKAIASASQESSMQRSTSSSVHNESSRLPRIEESPALGKPSTPRPEEAKYSLAKMTIPKIPPFNPEKARSISKPEQGTQFQTTVPAPNNAKEGTSLSSLKLSAKASEFKPFNPSAAVFKPGGSAPSKAVQAETTRQQPHGSSADEPAVSSTQDSNPFFGSKEIKRHSGSVPVNVFGEFSPLRAARKGEPPSMITPWWPFNGRDFRMVFMPVPGTPGTAFPLSSGGSDHSGTSKSPVPAPARIAPAVPMPNQPFLVGANAPQAPFGFAYPASGGPQMGAPYRLHPQPPGASPRPFAGPPMPGMAVPGPYFQAPFSPPMPPHAPGAYSPHMANAPAGPGAPFVVAQPPQPAPTNTNQRMGSRSSFNAGGAPNNPASAAPPFSSQGPPSRPAAANSADT